MPVINVDGTDYEVAQGDNLLQACLSNGLDLPYFCWHPAMGSVGACRQCAVIAYQDADDTRGRLTMACMTPATEGARISIDAAHAEAFRASVIEWLMENHPHDCPVCEEGGECHLQDMTVMTGHTTRVYRGEKRTFENQDLGPLINHEMNRCITCYRCVRFYRDYAGGTDLEAFGSRSRMYFGRAQDGTLENEFSGNLVEVCPTGVFTDKPFSATYTRKWDLQSAPSICTGCAVGCNTMAAERYGVLKRIHNRYHPDVNGYFICDRGRFGMTYTNSEDRIRHAGVASEPGVFRIASPDEVTARIGESLGRAVGIGSPRASLEDNLALRRLVGAENYSHGLNRQAAEVHGVAASLRALGTPSVRGIEDADAVLVLGEDVSNTAPRVALALRQATRNLSRDMADEAGIPQWQDAGVRGHAQAARNPLLIATLLPTRLDDVAQATLRADSASCAEAAREIARRLAGESNLASATGLEDFVVAAVDALRSAQRPLVVTGTAQGESALIEAAAAIVRSLRSEGDADLVICGEEANAFGVATLGGLPVDDLLTTAAAGEVDTLIVMQNDLYRRAPKAEVDAALGGAKRVLVIDSLDNATASRAHVVLPAATAVESTGTLVNQEYRAQRHYQVFVPTDDIRPSWQWLSAIGQAAGREDGWWTGVDGVLAALAEHTGFAGVTGAAASADYRSPVGQKVPRSTHRASGRTAMYADATMHEPKSTVDDQTPFAYSMEGNNSGNPGSVIPYVWSPGWNSNQSLFKFQAEVGGSLQGGDPGYLLPVVDVAGSRVGSSAGRDLHPGVAPQFALVPVVSVFGSEELSGYAPAIRERMDRSFVVLCASDAAALGVGAGDGVVVDGHSLEVRVDEAMPEGVAAVSVGMPQAPPFLGAAHATLRADPDFVRTPTIIARG